MSGNWGGATPPHSLRHPSEAPPLKDANNFPKQRHLLGDKCSTHKPMRDISSSNSQDIHLFLVLKGMLRTTINAHCKFFL